MPQGRQHPSNRLFPLEEHLELPASSIWTSFNPILLYQLLVNLKFGLFNC